MGPSIQLLGVPRIVLPCGSQAQLRGQKAWGILSYLVIRRESVSRQHLARLLFEDAEDPLAALRWNLTELRRALGPESLRGEVLSVDRTSVASIDVDVLTRGSASDGVQLCGVGLELLEGLRFASSPSFEVWLQTERRRMQATSEAVLHEAALARLASGDSAEAVDLAGRLLAIDPLNESAQILLVRCLATSGDGVGAARQAATCRELFKKELGIVPGKALDDALCTATASAVSRPATGRAGTLAQMEAGEAAIAAGVLESGLQCLRRSISDADATGDPVLRARARLALGGALVHAARGRDDEGAAALHQALSLGREAAPEVAAAACRELGYVDFLLGRYDRALTWIERAEPLAFGDVAECARLATLHGSILSDMAYYEESLERLRSAQIMAEEANAGKQCIYAQSMIGRVLVLTGNHEEAVSVLDRCIDQAGQMWTAFLPWPESFRGEADLLRGHIDEAAHRFDHSFALGCQMSDPCWEGISGRGLGLVKAARGDVSGALTVLLDALKRCGRLPDAYLWGSVYVLDALCELGISFHDERATHWIDQLMKASARSGMRELMARAHRHRARLGDREAALAWGFLATEIDNPVLKTIAT